MSPRLDQMSMRDLEEAGQRFYERKGLMLGEQDDTEIDDEPLDPYDEWIADRPEVDS